MPHFCVLEMASLAGSDLDGDEYAVIWDPELALERNEPAADYSPVREEAADSQNSNEIDIVDFHTEMAAFFVNYLKNDSIGRISNAHLFNSDLYGLNAQVCASIARKHQQALDFSKTGKPPKELRNDWSQDDPPERFERAPDFNLKGIIVEPQYVSPRLNGQLFRRAKELSNFVTASISKEIHNNEIEEDKWLLSKEGHEEYLQRAQQCYDDYSYSLKNLMDNYGIICEGELFSSTYSVLRNKLSEQEGEDMSFYTTTKIINDKLKCIVNEARQAFFAVFGGCEEEFTNEDGICEEPTEEMQILARAYYTISYLTKAEKRCFLSFPWITCWDILDFIKRTSLMAKGRALFTFDPFGDRISEYIQQFLAKNSNAFLQFKKKMITKNENKSEEIFEWKEILWRYSQRHKGLDKLLFFCVEWAKYKQIFEQTPLREEHICLLLISYGLLILPNAQILSEKSPWLIETPTEWIESPQNPKHSIKQIGRRFCSFLEGLASRQFLQLPNLHFEHLGLNNSDFFGNGEWRPICRIAMATYQHLVFADRLDGALPPLDENAMNIICPNEELMEGTVFQIELPGKRICEEFISDENLLQKLCSKTGCQQIVMRRHPRIFYNRAKEPKPMRVLISSWGRREALERLFELFAVHPKLNLNTNRRLQIQMIPEETFEKLDHILNGPKRQRELDLPELEFEDEENEMDDVQMALALPIEDEYSTDEDVVYDDDDYLDDEE